MMRLNNLMVRCSEKCFSCMTNSAIRCVRVYVSVTQRFFQRYSRPRGKSSDLQSLLIFLALALVPFRCVHFNFDCSYRRWCIFYFSLSYDCYPLFVAAFFPFFYSSVFNPSSVLFLIAQLFLNTVIFVFPFFSAIVPTRNVFPPSMLHSPRPYPLRPFINMFYCTFECMFPYMRCDMP